MSAWSRASSSANANGFVEVVVATGLQPLDAVVHGSPGAQDQNRSVNAARTDAIDQRQPVQTREHHVNDCGVVPSLHGQLDSPFPIGGNVDDVTGFSQTLADEVGNRRVVFDHEHSHDIL